MIISALFNILLFDLRIIMTEKEKMLAHQWYDANFDDELKEDRLQAKELCF